MNKKYTISIHLYIALLIMVSAGFVLKYYVSTEEVVLAEPLNNFPGHIGEWHDIGSHKLGYDVLEILKVDDYIMRDYSDNKGSTSSLYIGYYKTHRDSVEIHTPEHCQAGGGWEILNKKKRSLAIAESGREVSYVEAVYEKDQEKMLFIYWYLINGEFVTNFFHYKLSIMLNSLINHRSDASFIRIAVPIINDDIKRAVKVSEKFISDAIPVIEKYLPST